MNPLSRARSRYGVRQPAIWSVGGVLMRKSSPCSAWCGCEREKVRHAWLVGGDSGRKFAMRGQNAPNWAILGEQGEFCIAHAVRRGVQGEFYTEVARRGSCWASFVPPWCRPCHQLPASRRPLAPRPGPVGLPVPSISPLIRRRRDPEGSRLSLRAVAALSAPISQRQKLSARASAR